MQPARGLVLVRRTETEETMPGGRIILTQTERENMAAYQCEVIAVGEPEKCDNLKKCRLKYHTKDCHPTSLKANDWILVRPRSLIQPNSDTKEYLVKQSDVLAVFRTPEGHDEH